MILILNFIINHEISILYIKYFTNRVKLNKQNSFYKVDNTFTSTLENENKYTLETFMNILLVILWSSLTHNIFKLYRTLCVLKFENYFKSITNIK